MASTTVARGFYSTKGAKLRGENETDDSKTFIK